LQNLIQQFGNDKNLFVLCKKNEPEETPAGGEKNKPLTADDEIKLHQHIIKSAEEVKLADDPEAAIEAKQAVVENLSNGAAEEIVFRKKSSHQPDSDSKKAVSLNEKFRKDAKALADKLHVSKSKTIKDLFDLNERYSFIQNLFGGSSDQFKKAMNDLSKCSSRQEAEVYIKNIEEKYLWKNQEKLAVRFTERVLKILQ
ncbi:MAG TPA: hypothetical protein VNJ07_03830, partial [Chitinophagales bacterium]|nr:hypothetical protein [Chitinophagales bacterium]